MIRDTVTWHPLAERDLAQLWLSSANRPAISDATNRVDAILSSDADARGTHITGPYRSLHVAPLLVVFEVKEQDRIAEVVHVRRQRTGLIDSQAQSFVEFHAATGVRCAKFRIAVNAAGFRNENAPPQF